MKNIYFKNYNREAPSFANINLLGRCNVDCYFDLVKYISKFNNVKYIQTRRVSTETRLYELSQDMLIYDELYQYVKKNFKFIRQFYSAEIYEIYGKEVCFWPTVQTTVNSYNYFTDGTISKEYFVIEGYLKNYNKEA